jgi:threonine dehydrogenase-like Zn-dependent dehydrogenase
MIERELTMVGSVGNPHVNLGGLLRLVGEGKLRPADLVSEQVALSRVNEVLDRMGSYDTLGFSMVTDTSA